MNIKTGDTVVLLTGKYEEKKDSNGKVLTHKVIAVSPKENKVIVEGVNTVHKHVKPRRQGEQGGIVDTNGAIYACKVALYCSDCGKGVRVKHAEKDGKKIRVCAKCGKEL
ncbi:MAG: 50S ribosomal protein L24 [Clostridia bacterium]|nr:50S ribosomal protein L24 [Clostridia bacterium]